MPASVRTSATTARYTSTKCAKSRNSKKRRSSSVSTGTMPGWRMASSATIAGEADPTWRAGSSAPGRPAMNDDRSGRSCLRRRLLRRLDDRLDTGLEVGLLLAVDEDRPRPGDMVLRHLVRRVQHPLGV